MTLENRVALVTGAGRGIGRAIALRYAQAGARVAIADLRVREAEAVVQTIESAGGSALAIEMDVTDEAAVDDGLARVAAAWGGLDIAVCNAGIQHLCRLESLALHDWKRVLSVHLDGAFLITRAALPMLAARGGGALIYMGSVHSKEASVQKGPYVVAKHGLLGLCRTVAKEAGPQGVRANVICPGFVRTELLNQQLPELARTHQMTEDAVLQELFLSSTVDGVLTTPEDIAETALFLAAHPSAALTGQSIVVSHGWHMQ